jgi:endonuclease/exonuclease/phosphatase family metal-dependent hydrolase
VKPPCFLILLLAVLAAGLLPATPPDAEPASVRIATWNVRNYLTQNRWHDGAYRFDYPKPEAEKDRLRAVIHAVNPDILLLQEFGGPAFLREFREDLQREGLAYPYFHFQAVPGSRTGLALLSRLPPAESILLVPPPSREDDDRPAVVRGLQELLFHLNGHALRLFHVHLKSRYTTFDDDPESRRFRAAEIARLEAIIRPRLGLADPSETLLIAGDFNTPFSHPLLNPLREDWQPLPVADADGRDWTYLHFKSGRRDTIDGFWQRRPAADGDTPSLRDRSPESTLRPVGVFPVVRNPAGTAGPNNESTPEQPDLTDRIGSDHRMVVIEWVPGKG